jgi:hypothetical protein
MRRTSRPTAVIVDTMQLCRFYDKPSSLGNQIKDHVDLTAGRNDT